MKIYEINLYDGIDNRQYVQADTEQEAVNYFIRECVLKQKDKTRYEKEYKEGNTENFYIEEIEIYNKKTESIYKISYRVETESEQEGNEYFIKALDSEEAFEKYLIKYSKYLEEEEIEAIKKDFEEGDNNIIDVYEIVVE